MAGLDLIGYHYRLGAAGDNREIDCIHMVLQTLQEMGIETPSPKQEWYEDNPRLILQDLEAWGARIPRLKKDGDVLVRHENGIVFAVVSEGGLLYVDRTFERVAWGPLRPVRGRCYRWRGLP